MASPDSQVALEFDNYQSEIRERAIALLTRDGHAAKDGDTIVDVLGFEVVSRTEAAIAAFLEDNEIRDRDEHTDEIIEEVYRSGLRMHALVSFLGQYGIRLVAASEDGTALELIVGTVGESEERDDEDQSMMALLIGAVQDNLVDESETIDERTELAGNNAQQTQHVGMFAIHRAVLDLEMDITHGTEEDLMNRGAQLFCIMASVQSANGKLFFVDKEGYGLPLVDDLNDVAKGPSLDEDAEDSTGE
jgi:hypothetical protein